MTVLRLSSLPRVSAAAVLVGASTLLLVFQTVFRGWEAQLASVLFSAGTPTSANSERATVYFGLGQPGAFGLRITPECSAAFIIAPLALIGAAMLWRQRIAVSRVLFGVGVAALLVALSNQLRVGMIAWLIESFGLQDGYRWGHLVVGSIVSLLFLAASLVLLVWIVSASPRRTSAPSISVA